MKDTVFKAYDIRGIYPEEINEDLAYKVGRAFVRFLSAKTVVVGRDMRSSSPSLREKLVEGISCEGADVIDIGICTTPMLNFAVAKYGYDGGIMISASHNPSQYNAFKLIKPGPIQLDEESGIKEIKNIASGGFAECANKGAVTEKDTLGDYLAYIMGKIDGISNLKVVVDYGNGVGSIPGKPAFARLDVDLVEIYDTPDGNFPNHLANPHDEGNFKDLKNKVMQKHADLGIFFDGDAERAWFVDDLGRIVPTDLLYVLLAERELAEHPKEKCYFDLRFSKVVPKRIKKAGGAAVMMRVGNPFYKKALKAEGGVIAAEYSGHIMYAENFGIDDGLFASLKTLSLIAGSKKKLSELIDLVQEYETSEEISLEAKNPEVIYEKIYSEFPEGKEIELDGAYIDFKDGFISVRQSQTEPKLFRIRVEAKTKGELDDRLNKVKKILTES